MKIQSITLQNYRSYESASFEFGSGVTIIVGPNASGKTNLLEAVRMSTQGTSFRVSDKDLIAHGADWSRIQAVYESGERTVKLENGGPKIKKSFDIDGTKRGRLGFEYTVPTVLFEPDDMRIVYGSPERRRRFLDELLSQLYPTYRPTLLRYQKLLKHRNTLLKSGRSLEQLFAWNISLARAAEELVTRRAELTTQLDQLMAGTYNTIADRSDHVAIEYETDTDIHGYATKLIHKLEHSIDRDLARGFTSYGPHKDELKISIKDRPALSNASRGEARTIMLALKILETNLLEQVRGQTPLLLLDDVFSELDGTRRRLLTTFLSDKQSIITTTDADIVGKSFTKLATIISL